MHTVTYAGGYRTDTKITTTRPCENCGVPHLYICSLVYEGSAHHFCCTHCAERFLSKRVNMGEYNGNS